jgi:hypothetical protein
MNEEDEVHCWHIEPGSPCDWDVCHQPERLEQGDYGTDPAAEDFKTPNLDRIRETPH